MGSGENMTKKVVRKNLVDQVCDILQESIIKGEYQAGEKLPSEQELANQFGTSRLTVRLAIQRLNTMELLETKVGDGTYVKDFSYEKYIGNISKLIFTPEMMGDIKDFRICIETGFTVLAARNRLDSELVELEQICAEYESLYTENFSNSDAFWNMMGQKDYDIHMKICEMSHNALYKLCYSTVKILMVDYMKTIIKTRKARYETKHENEKFIASLKSHRKLYEAIAEKNEDKCRDIVKNIADYEVLVPEDYFTSE